MTDTDVSSPPSPDREENPGGIGLRELLGVFQDRNNQAPTDMIERAFAVADKAHRGQFRKSGDPYITHPLAVATIIAEMGLPDSVVAAGLLHDVVEDTENSLEDIARDFGDEVAMIVDGVTKLDKVTFGEAAQAETVRKMVVAMAKDIRVLLLKLADRLHNARTWEFVAADTAKHKAQETLEIYAPLAHRMGLNTLKWELEDLSFRTLYPRIYEQIVDVVAERAPQREKVVAQMSEDITEALADTHVSAQITGRPKHYYSVYQKMIVRGRDLTDIYDLVGVRILVDSVRDCYAALGAMHARFTPVPGRFKDYIATPKFNLYQSLHTTVVGPTGKPVELQIRTHDMHRRAEYGLAAHWRYKESNPAGADPHSGELGWLRQIADWQQETADPSDFLEALRGEIGRSEVYVFTPLGHLHALPVGATPIDFAYAVHTEVGHKTIGARVNGRLVPLNSKLDNGDTVEVLTSSEESAGPNRDWLEFAESARARNKIRHWFTRERREESIDAGRDMLAKAIRREHLPIQRLMTKQSLTAIAADFHYDGIEALYAAIGERKEQPGDVVARMVAAVGGAEGADEDVTEITRPGARRLTTRRKGDLGITVHGLSDVQLKLAKCCSPVPGDGISGYVTRGSGVSVHRHDCDNLAALAVDKERIVDVAWTGKSTALFTVQIEVEALDRARLLTDVAQVLSDHHLNIISANVATSRERVAISTFSFEMADTSHLGAVLSAVRKVEGVYEARRITGAKSSS